MEYSEEARIDVHEQEKAYNGELKLFNGSGILPENKALVLDFLSEYADGLSFSRKAKYLIRFCRFARELDKPFLKADRKDIQKLEKMIETAPPMMYNRKKQKWVECHSKCSPWTVADSKNILRVLYKWIEYSFKKTKKKEDRLRGDKLREVLKRKPAPELVEDVVGGEKKRIKLTAKDMLTWDEVVKMSQTCTCLRDKAAIQVMGESGLRTGEFLTLQVQDVEVKKMGDKIVAIVHVRQSKTEEKEGIRSIAIVNSTPALVEYIKTHPLRGQKNAPLWVKYKNKEKELDTARTYMPYDCLRKILMRAGRLSGFGKKANPHHLRKSCASRLGHTLNEQQIKQFLGWTTDTKVLKHYMFLREEETNKRYLESQGIKVDDKDRPKIDEAIKPFKCECGVVNPAGELFCVACHNPLGEDSPALIEMNARIDQRVMRIMRGEIPIPKAATTGA